MADFDYDHQAGRWKRDQPKSLEDFLDRNIVFDEFKKIGKGRVVLDLGCGEGYFSRKISSIANKVIGVDRSKSMISLAIESEKKDPRGVDYHIADVRRMGFIRSSSIDVCVGNFITNYLKPEQLPSFYNEMARVLKKGGKFILLVPHPFFQCKESKSVHFEHRMNNYIRDRGKFFPIKITTIRGDIFEVGQYHSTLQDHFDAFFLAGLSVHRIIETFVSKQLVKKYPIFSDLEGEISNMIIIGGK